VLGISPELRKKWIAVFVQVYRMKRNSLLKITLVRPRLTHDGCAHCWGKKQQKNNTTTSTDVIPHMIPTYTYRAITRVPGYTGTFIGTIIVVAVRIFVTSFAFVDAYLKEV